MKVEERALGVARAPETQVTSRTARAQDRGRAADRSERLRARRLSDERDADELGGVVVEVTS